MAGFINCTCRSGASMVIFDPCLSQPRVQRHPPSGPPHGKKGLAASMEVNSHRAEQHTRLLHCERNRVYSCCPRQPMLPLSHFALVARQRKLNRYRPVQLIRAAGDIIKARGFLNVQGRDCFLGRVGYSVCKQHRLSMARVRVPPSAGPRGKCGARNPAAPAALYVKGFY